LASLVVSPGGILATVGVAAPGAVAAARCVFHPFAASTQSHRNDPGLRLLLGPCDLLEGTPILDIKPYVPAYDAFPESAAGWIDTVETLHAEPPAYAVSWSLQALEQAEWLKAAWSVDFQQRLVEILGRDPRPHRTRRIRRLPGGDFVIGCGTWRAEFQVQGFQIEIQALKPSFPVRFLLESWREGIPDRDAQLAFMQRWPCPELELREGESPNHSRPL